MPCLLNYLSLCDINKISVVLTAGVSPAARRSASVSPIRKSFTVCVVPSLQRTHVLCYIWNAFSHEGVGRRSSLARKPQGIQEIQLHIHSVRGQYSQRSQSEFDAAMVRACRVDFDYMRVYISGFKIV